YNQTKTENLKLSLSGYSKALFELMKPRVMSLVIFTCVVGLLVAPNIRMESYEDNLDSVTEYKINFQFKF
ncbi:MAG: hypothetical protein QF795_01795, partial [Candidatus Marinimicrobia bacterium]|nr:hypothetical protein [Candidatus Neomarinimicrobiota bacterium]